MHSKSCLAACIPLSAFMILLFWFLKDFGCSVSNQCTDRFWQSHPAFLQPGDDVTVWMDGQQGGQRTGWVGGWCFVGHFLAGGWDQKLQLCPRGRGGGLWHWAWRWPWLHGKVLEVWCAVSRLPACSTPGSRERHSTLGSVNGNVARSSRGGIILYPASLQAVSSFKLSQHRRKIKNHQWVQ